MRHHIDSDILNGLILLIVIVCFNGGVFAQVSANFIISEDSVCQNAFIEINNESFMAESYYWDFCGGEFDLAPAKVVKSIPESYGSNIYGLKSIQYQGDEYLFIVDRTGRVFRIKFSGGLIIDSELIVSSGLSLPWDIDIIQDHNGEWFGFVGSETQGFGLIRLNFGNSITNSPSIDTLGVFSQGASRVRSVHVVNINDQYKLLLTIQESKRILVVDFLSDLSNNNPTYNAYDLGGVLGIPVDAEFIYKDGSWFGYVLEFLSDRVYRADFGTNFSAIPTNVTQIALPENTLGRHLEIVDLSDTIFVQVSMFSNGQAKSYWLSPPTGGNTANYIDHTITTGGHFSFLYDSGQYRGYSFEGGSLYEIRYTSDCGENLAFSGASDIGWLKYNVGGDKQIRLIAEASDDTYSVLSDTIHVTTDIVPDVVINIDDNKCLLNANLFGVDNSLDLTSFSWDFNNDGIEDSNQENPQVLFDTLGGVGSYTVRLDVTSDNGCHNFTTQDITIYPEPPVPTFDIVTDFYCVENQISLVNTTDDSGYDGLVDYHWTVTDLGDSTTTDWDLQFSSPGEKIISVYSSIPGCESVTVKDTLTILDSPTVGFSASQTCDGDLTTFTNNSVADTYQWDFGDGTFSSEVSPDHLYANAGTFEVVLIGRDLNGCPNTETQTVKVDDLPVADFSYSQLCAGEPAGFTDLSLVNGGSIVAWKWYVDSSIVSTAQNPDIAFETGGTHSVQLVAYGSNSCEDSISVMVEVQEEQIISLSTELNCLGQPSVFLDETSYAVPVQSRLWLVDDVLISGESGISLSHELLVAGEHSTMLIANLENGCTAIKEVTYTLPENPEFLYTTSTLCDNEAILLTDTTEQIVGNEILTRTWFVDGKNVGSGIYVTVPGLSSGNHQLSVVLSTAFECELEVIGNLAVNGSPNPDFVLSSDYGIPPFSLSATNQTTNATSYEWYLDDELIATSMDITTTIIDEGLKELKLVAYNEEGCMDSVIAIINSALPLIDLELQELQLSDNGSQKEILVQVQNKSNLPVEVIDFNLTLENEFTLSERVLKRIDVGKQTVIKLKTTIPSQSTAIGYLCVTGSTSYEVEDVTPVNNEICAFVSGSRAVVEPPYPNPAKNSASINVILPEQGNIKVSILNLAGDEVVKKLILDAKQGLNVFEVSLLRMEAGTYIIMVAFDGGNKQFRIIKH
ncbi:PKD domain-containing protein [Marinoscillum sp. MHG1-6]|uniref:PKD domain-containing protein n=1 Tax=Marinoscillum sp. MHG1-6 TaxID=2959627 RepID=UPI0021570218|nr:PKD domain-containing protein [Marinoscillum sp. MHG1-6]